MNVIELIAHLERMGACDESIDWLRALPSDSSAYDAWRRCERGCWLVWLVTHAGVAPDVGDSALRLIACDCAEASLPTWEAWARENAPEHIDAPRLCIEVTRAFGNGDVNTSELIAASAAAREAASAAAWAAARAAARAAASAARAAAWDAARAAARVARDAARVAWVDQARIVRRHVKWSAVRDALSAASVEAAQ